MINHIGHEHVIRKLSNRDLSLSDVLLPWSEMELGRGYGDLVLMPNRRYRDARYSYLLDLLELKSMPIG